MKQFLSDILALFLVFFMAGCAVNNADLLSRITEPVLMIDGCVGSGVILKKEGNVYSVVTARHVAKMRPVCTVIAPNGATKTAQSSYPWGENESDPDLAILTFTWEEKDWQNSPQYKNLPLARLGNSLNLRPLDTIYVVGFPEKNKLEQNRVRKPLKTYLSADQAQKSGYSLSYDADTKPGMSGGGIFTEQGLLVGIHGEGLAIDGVKSGLGISLSKFSQILSADPLTNIILSISWREWLGIISGGVVWLVIVVSVIVNVAKNIGDSGRRTFLGFFIVAIVSGGAVIGFNNFVQKKDPSTPIQSATPPQPAATNTSSADSFIEDLGNGIMLEMIKIPTGTFLMGSPDGERYSDEHPQHKVEIKQSFYMGKFQVTQGQWNAIMGSNPSYFKKGDNYPVEAVSWNDSQAFLEKLNIKTGKDYRLPSEAEWEYACRVKSNTKYYFGNDENQLKEYAWYGDNSGSSTHPVGEKKPNQFGLYDMHGNVWEWCQDKWENNYNKPRTQEAYTNTTGSSRVLRGGSWYIIGIYCRSAFRGRNDADTRNYSIGFRVVV